MKNIRITRFFLVLLLSSGDIIAQHTPGPYIYQPRKVQIDGQIHPHQNLYTKQLQ
jgi:hypothetical protein